ncbi:MAG: hypothetical protein CMF12_06970 [Idiomarina sp.]|uniref:sulfotransferase family protein n=1 Tax=Idiomarina sp. TaxID=1874361 RepID=UPI000C39A551|nr:sulfotransferase [Idiomarina sp.]MBT42252.1 hypothetical protein [Idiomarina sp.]
MHQYLVVRNPEVKGQLRLRFPVAGYLTPDDHSGNYELGGFEYTRKQLKRDDRFFVVSHNKPIDSGMLDYEKTVNAKDELAAFKVLLPELTVTNERYSFTVIHQQPNGEQQVLFSVAVAKTSKPTQAIFVTGSPRSGTTAMGNALQRAFNHKVHGEAHLADMMAQIDSYSQQALIKSPAYNNEGTLINQLNAADIQMNTVLMIRGIHEQFYGKDLVLDKTPGGPNINALWLMLKAYPEAKIIYCQRRGLENVISRLKKFPDVSFEGHCKQWRQSLRLWNAAKQSVSVAMKHQDWFYRVEQLLVARAPEETTNTIGNWLALTSAQQKRMSAYLKQQSPQQSSDFKAAVDLDKLDWTAEQKSVFLKICGPEMKNQGYSLDEHYFL